MGLRNFDVSGAIQEAVEKAAHKACKRATLEQLRAINDAAPSVDTRAQAGWIAAKCRRCQGCSMAPR